MTAQVQDGVPAMVRASLDSLEEMRRDLVSPADDILECLKGIAEMQQVTEQVRQHCESRLMQSALEQGSLMELHELYISML